MLGISMRPRLQIALLSLQMVFCFGLFVFMMSLQPARPAAKQPPDSRNNSHLMPVLERYMMESFHGSLVCVTSYLGKGPLLKDSYRRETLARTLKELVATVAPNSSIAVVDDGSSKGNVVYSIEEVSKYRDSGVNVALITRLKNGGISRAKNSCIKYFLESTRHRHLCQVDSDLSYLPGWMEPYVSALDAGFRFLQHNPKLRKEAVYNTTLDDGTVVYALPFPGEGIVQCFSRDVVWAIGGYLIFPFKYGVEHLEYAIRAHYAGLLRVADMDVESPVITHLETNMFSWASKNKMVEGNNHFRDVKHAEFKARGDFYVPIVT